MLLSECYSYEWMIATCTWDFSATPTQMWLWQYISHITTYTSQMHISVRVFGHCKSSSIYPHKCKCRCEARVLLPEYCQQKWNQALEQWRPMGRQKHPSLLQQDEFLHSYYLLARFSTQLPSQWRNQKFCTFFMFGVRFNYYIVYLEQFIYFQERNKCQPQFW